VGLAHAHAGLPRPMRRDMTWTDRVMPHWRVLIECRATQSQIGVHLGLGIRQVQLRRVRGARQRGGCSGSLGTDDSAHDEPSRSAPPGQRFTGRQIVDG
jgi:hypothetical protein